MAIGNHNDLTHIVRTSDQWKNTYDKYELIPNGVLCVELVSSDVTKIKIGDGHNIFSKLPYIGDLDLSKYYTKLETDTRIKEILSQEKVVRIKGILNSKSDLPADARCGDIYFVRQLSSSDNKYIEYIYSPDNTWEPLGGIPVDIDLSEYAKTAYVDDKIEQVNERIDDIEQHGTHTHPNKEILDQITEPYTTADKETLASLHNYDDTEIREMISQSSHTHANKEILDATSAAFTREDKSKLDQLNPYDDSVLKEKITALERLAHEHSNKRILDQTTASFTKEYERKMRWIRIYTGCTGMEEGIAGLVPAAQAGEEDYVLSGSGEWVPQTGGGGTYTLPIATASTLGGIKVGDGLSIDPATGVLSATGGGSGGDSIAEGGGITITTDPQTGVKTISVNTGDNLEVDPDTGELNITGVDYTAGQGIFIGNEYQNVEYIKNSGNYDQIILTDIIPAFSDKIELDIKFGAPSVATVWDRPIMGCNGTTPSTFLYTVTLYLASNDSNLGCYNHFKYETGNTGRNFFIRPSGISYDGSSSVRKTLTMKGSTATWGTDSKEFSSEYNSSFIDPQIGIAVFGRAGQSSNTIFNSCELTVYGVKLYDSNDTLLHNLVPVKKLSNNEGGLYDTVTNKFYGNSGNGSFVTGPAVETDDRIINAKIGSGLGFDSNNAIEVLTGAGLSINQDNELEVLTGNGLQINQDGEVEIDPSIIPEAAEYSSGEAITIRDVSQILPAGYVEVDYIEGIGNYTVINYIPNRKTKIVGTASQTQTSYDPVLFGNRTGSNGQQFVFWFNRYDSTQAKVGFVYGTNTWSTSSDCDNGKLIPYTLEDQFTFLISLDDEFNINDSFVHNITENGAPASNLKLGIFALVNSSSDEIESSDQIFRGRMYEFKIYEDDELVVNLIPAVSTSTNQSGFYDVINDIFYTSKTATPFGYDPSTIHSTGKVIDVNYGNGLTVNQNNELEVNIGDGLLVNANNEVELSNATSNTLGGIKVGSGFVYTSDGLLNATPAAPPFDVGDGLELIYDDIDALPNGYGHVDYVCSNPENNSINAHGRARTLIDYVPTNTTKLAIRMQRDSERSDLCFIGSRIASRDHEFCFWNEYSSVTELAFPYGNTNYSNAYVTYPSYITGQIIEVECVVGDTSNTLSVNGTVVKTYTKDGDASPYKLGIFQLYLNGSWANQPANGKIYYIKLYEGNTLAVNLIPAVRLVDEVVGFYDNVNDKFYTSNTEYPFTTDMSTLVIDGAPRTLNVIPATANTIGGIKVGTGLSIAADGTLSTTGGETYDAGNGIEITEVTHEDEFRVQNQEYFFTDHGLTCIITGNYGPRTYTKINDGDIVAAVIGTTGGWYMPLFVGLTEDSVKYSNSYDSTIIGPTGSFTYHDKTWYYSADYALTAGDGVDHAGHLQSLSTTYATGSEGNIQAAKDLIDLAVLLPDTSTTTISAKIGAGLSFDANGAIQADAQPLSPATDSTLGGVIVGDGILVDNDGTISVDPTIIPEVIEYEAGTAISIEEVEHGGVTFDAWNSGTGWTNWAYTSSTGDSGQYWAPEVHSPVADSWKIPLGATQVRVKAFSTSDVLLHPSIHWLTGKGTGRFGYADPTGGMPYDSWLEVNSNATYMNLGIRRSEGSTVALSPSEVKSVELTFQKVSEIEVDVWNGGTGWLNGDYGSGTSNDFYTNWYYTYHYNYQQYIEVPEGATHVMVRGISNENDSHFEGGGCNAFDSNHHHVHWWGCAWEWQEITSDVKYVQPNVKWNDSNTRTISGSAVKSVTLVWKLPALEINQAINVKYGNGLTVNQNNELELELTRATETNLGGIKIGSGFTYLIDGTLNANPAMQPFEVGDALELLYDDPDALPTGYAHVDYVSSNPATNSTSSTNYGRARTLIDYTPENVTKLEIKMARDNDYQDSCFVGCRVSGSENHFVLWHEDRSSDTQVAFVYGSKTYSDAKVNVSYVTGQVQEIEANIPPAGTSGNITVSVNGNVVKTYAKSGSPLAYKLGIFQSNRANEWEYQISNGRIYYLRLYEGDTLAVNLIPAVRLADDVVGFYDNVNDKFYTSSTDYPFTTDMSTIVIDGAHRTLNVKYNNGLMLNQNNELEVDLGSGLRFDANGAIEVVGGGGSGGNGDYTAGDAIEFRPTQLSFNVDAIRWDISNIKSTSQTSGPWTQVRYIEFCDDSGTPYTISSASGIWEDNTSITYSTTGGSQTINDMIANTQKMCAIWRYPDHTMQLTFNLDTAVPCADIAKFRIKLGDDVPERDPKSWKVYFRDASTQIWYVVQDIANAELSDTRDIWSNYYPFDITGATSINVKYGTGLAIDPITGELFVDGQLPEGTILKKLTYMGNGSTSANNIQFEKKPLAILSIYGTAGTNYIASNPAPIDAPYLMGDYGGVNTNNTSSCAMSYNDSTNVLTLSPSSGSSGDAGLLYNVNERTYTVWYLVKGHTEGGTSATNEVSVIKSFTYVGDGNATNTIQFPETPDTLITIYGVAVNNDISSNTVPITARYLMGEYGSGGNQQYGVVSCNMSFNDTTNILTLTGGVDAGARYNVSGETYTVIYSINETISSGGGSDSYEPGTAIDFSNQERKMNPNMTSDVLPYGEVIESGHYSTRYGWNAFDGVDSQTWQSHCWGDGTNALDNDPDLCYVGYVFPEDVYLDKFILSTTSDREYTAVIQTRSEGIWTTVCNVTVPNTGYDRGTYTLQSPVLCDAFRFAVLSGTVQYWTTSSYGGNVCNFEAYGYSESSNQISVKYGDGLTVNNSNELEVNLGSGLSFDANGAIEVTGGGGSGDTVAEGNGISITTDQQTGNKVIAVNAGSGLQVNQTTNELEVSSGVVTSIAPTQNTPGSITVTEGDGTATPVQVLSQMGGATSSTAGTAGYVPAPSSGDDDAYLRGDGTWDDDVVTENDLLTLVFVPDDYTPPTP